MDGQTHVTLTRLLSRLDSQSIPPSSYERAKTQRNIEHARTLLLTLEKQSATLRVQSQRQDAQADLQRKREIIKRLSARLQEAEEEESEEDGESEDDEQAQAVSYEPARTDTESGLDTGQTPALQAEVLSQQAQQARQSPSQSTNPTRESELRPRRPLQASDNRSTASTTARDQLFANRSQPSQELSNLSKSETLLSHNRTEQENLTTSLLSLAGALKQSSLQFGASLEGEKEVLKRAEGGLDKSALGMEAAERKMGALRRMSEGQGWWGRVKLYGFIFALWVACFLVVFVGPKIRF